MRAPLIFAGAGVPTTGGVCPSPVEFVDLYPTIAEIAGLEAPSSLEGVSLGPLLENPEHPWERPAFSEVHFREVSGRAIRTRKWRYVEWGEDGEAGRELYDQEADPRELDNLVEDPAQAEVVDRLRARLGRNRFGTRSPEN